MEHFDSLFLLPIRSRSTPTASQHNENKGNEVYMEQSHECLLALTDVQ